MTRNTHSDRTGLTAAKWLPGGLASLLLVAVAMLVAACSGADGASDQEQQNQANQMNHGVRVETLVLQPSSFSDVIEVTGTVKAVDDATLSAQGSGTVIALANLGTYVASGTAVAQLDPQIPRAAVEQAEANVEAAKAQFDLAEDNYNRQTPLYRDSIISAVEYETVRAQLSQARAQLAQANAGLASAQKQLANTYVRAPFSGLVEQQFVERGEQVSPGMPVVRIVNTSRVKISAGVPERYSGDLEVGTPVEVRFTAYNVGVRLGKISFVGSAIDSESRTFPIEVELENAGRDLKPQMVTQLHVTRQRLDDVLVVPRASVMRDELGNAVFVVKSGDRSASAERRSVVLGPSYGSNVVVTNGLAAGDEIVVAGHTNLTDGDDVQVVARSTGEVPGATESL